MMFKGKMQSESNFSIVPDDPYLWNVHLVTLGKTLAIGSILNSESISEMLRTSNPKIGNDYSNGTIL